MKIINVQNAKAQLSRLIEAAAAGEEIIGQARQTNGQAHLVYTVEAPAAPGRT